MNKELRYLLHGNQDEYENVQTYLYITSQESPLWQKVGLQILGRRGEAWRLIDSELVEHIPKSKYQSLKIEKLRDEKVIDDLIRPDPKYLDGDSLEKSERNELLQYLSSPNNKMLWQSLRLHETTDGRLEFVEPSRVYLEDPNYPLYENLSRDIVLIKKNDQIQQHWIEPWTPETAIAKILSLPEPHKYCDLILDALERMSNDQKESRRADLQNASWLLPNGYSPQDILKLPDNLKQHVEAIAGLDISKYPEQDLTERVRKSSVYPWIREQFTDWNEETVIEMILSHSNNSLEYWKRFCPIILDALSTNTHDKLKVSLSGESWLLSDQLTVSPDQVIKINSKKIQQYLSTLVSLNPDEYFEKSQLDRFITEHKNYKIIEETFNEWEEDDVLKFILDQDKPHRYYKIILDTLESLLPQYRPNSENAEKLRTKAWLVDRKENAIFPNFVLYYPDLDDEIKDLLSLFPDSYLLSSQLERQITNSKDCWQWLIEEAFITGDNALTEIGDLLSKAPEYQLGKFDEEEFPLDKCLEVFKSLDVTFLPSWNFANSLVLKEKFKEYLLPNLLDKMELEKLRDLLILLSTSNTQIDAAKIEVFNVYLGLAVKYEGFSQEILSRIQFLNRLGKWQTPDKLTWGNSENIDPNSLLDKDQEDILSQYLQNTTVNESSTSQVSVISNDVSNYTTLKNYFASWNHYCAWEPLGAFLVLLSGDDKQCNKLASNYLRNNFKLDSLCKELLQNHLPFIFEINVGSSSDKTRPVRSILGNSFDAIIKSKKKPVNLFINNLTTDTRRLELLPIQPDNNNFARHELIEILKESAATLLKNGNCSTQANCGIQESKSDKVIG